MAMTFTKKYALALAVCSLTLSFGVFGQEKVDQGRISIAIPELLALGGASKAEIEGVTSLIATEVANLPIFEVLERKASAAIYEEISFQLLTAGQMDEAVRDSRIKGARAILVGSYGRLYGRIVIATRLVDLQTGRVLFATSIYTDETNLKEAIKGLALTIMEKGFELGQSVKMDDIKQLVRSKNWMEARRLIDIFIRTNSPDDATRAVFATITDGLAGEYFKQAQRYVSQRLFPEARLRIAEAIALKPDGRFYEYRNTINATQTEWEFNQKILAARREESLRTGVATVDFGEALVEYYRNISVEGARIGASYGLTIADDTMEISADNGDWGIELSWADSYRPSEGRSILNWTWYAGFAARYEMISPGKMSLLLQAYASPLLAQSIKLGNLAIQVGLDAGPLIWYGAPGDAGYLWGVSAGAAAFVEIKGWERIGAFALGKADWRWYPGANQQSGPSLRLAFGLVL